MKVAAADLGATSGRVALVDLREGVPDVSVISRFRNGAVRDEGGRWVWPMLDLYASVAEGVAQAAAAGARSWGVDGWGVDFGVVRPGERETVGPVFSHRDPRHELGLARVDDLISWPEHYAICGIQRLAINTVYQLAADPARVTEGTHVLLVPDLVSYWATGVLASDVTDASTSAMVNPRTRQWDPAIIDVLGLPRSCFLPLEEPGRVRGPSRDPRMAGLPLIGVATHDTASAFAGAPVVDRDRALIVSLGTWALIGAEVVGAVPTDASREINLTHELGVDGSVRLLRNVTGMWLLEECRRWWGHEDGAETDLADLLARMSAAPALTAVFDVDEPALSHPGQSPQTIVRYLVGAADPDEWCANRGAVVRTLLESLVVRLAERAEEIERLLGGSRTFLHVVGGAARIPVLMQWIADATQKTVIAGPVEAAALGNAAVQWRTLGAVAGLTEARALIARMPDIATYVPAGPRDPWDAARRRVKEESGG